MKKILCVEDDPILQNMVTHLLEKEGFAVYSALTGEDGIAIAQSEMPDLILLDINLPGIDGYKVCELLRRNPKTAKTLIMMVSTKSKVEEIVQGFECWADDYVTKPFHPKLWMARIHALLRRKDTLDERRTRTAITINNLTIDPEAFVVTFGKTIIKLTKTEFDILYLLASHPNRGFSREQILDQIRGEDLSITDRIVDYQVFGLRKKLKDKGKIIETIRGIGYKFTL